MANGKWQTGAATEAVAAARESVVASGKMLAGGGSGGVGSCHGCSCTTLSANRYSLTRASKKIH